MKEVIAWQVADAMRQRGLSKTAMAEAMHTSRTQLDRLLDPANTGVALHTLYRAAAVLRKRLKVELSDTEWLVDRHGVGYPWAVIAGREPATF